MIEHIAFVRAECGDTVLAQELFKTHFACIGNHFNAGYLQHLAGFNSAALTEMWIASSSAVLLQSAQFAVRSLVQTGLLYYLKGFSQLSVTLFERALELLRNCPGCYPAEEIFGPLGNAYFTANLYNEAISSYEASIASIRRSSNTNLRLIALYTANIALCCHMMHQYADAAALFETTFRVFESHHDVFNLAVTLVHYSCSLYHLYRYKDSIATAGQALCILGLIRCKLTTKQQSTEISISQQAYAWLALSNLKMGNAIKAIGYLEYCSGDRARHDELMMHTDNVRIKDADLDHWVPFTLYKLNSPTLLLHVIRYQAVEKQILMFLVLPSRNKDDCCSAIYFRRLSFGDSEIRLWIENKMADFGIQGWSWKQFHFAAHRPALPVRDNGAHLPSKKDIYHYRDNSFLCLETLMLVVGAICAVAVSIVRKLLCQLICVVHPKQLNMCNLDSSHVFSQLSRQSISRNDPIITDRFTELVDFSNFSKEFRHKWRDKTAAFKKVKHKYNICPVKPPYFKELRVCRELYDIFLGPFSDELNSLGDYNEIIVIARDCTVYLPFNALLDSNGTYVIDKFKLLHSPSLMMSSHLFYNVESKLWHRITSCPEISEGKGIWQCPVLFGRSVFDQLPKLGVEKEMSILYSLFDSRRVSSNFGHVVGESGVQELRRALKLGSLVHIATHSTVFSIFVAEEGGDDQMITATDVADIGKLSPMVIILNTCLCGDENYLRDNAKGLVREFLCGGVVCVVRSLSVLDDNMAQSFTYQFYKLLLDSLHSDPVESLGFPEPDIGDAVQISMLIMSACDRRSPQHWSHFMTTGLWCNCKGVYL